MIVNELDQLSINISKSKRLVELGNAVERLYNNRDFRKVVEEGYFEQEAIRLVHLKADSNMQSAESQKAILIQMDAVGSFKQYLSTLMVMSNMAQKAIESDEQTRDELISEGLQ